MADFSFWALGGGARLDEDKFLSGERTPLALLVGGGGSKNLNSELLPLPVDPAGEPGVDEFVE